MSISRRLAAAAVVLVPSLLLSQAAPPPLTERLEVRVVNVDVTVTDRDGRPVTGLGPQDFELWEDGVRQEVSGFYEIRDAAVQAASEGTAQPAPVQDRFRRRMMLLFDNNSVSKVSRNAAIDYVTTFIDNEFSEDYEWSVVATGGSEVRTLQPFTNDKEAIRTALLKVRSLPTFESQRAIDRDILGDPVRARLAQQEFDNGYSWGDSARFVAREQTMRNVMASMGTARAIIQACRAYTSSAGKKVMLIVSGGIDMNTVFGAFENDKDRKQQEMRRDIEEIFETVVREANAANFNIYVVKADGLVSQASQHDVSNRGAGLGGDAKNPFFGPGFSKTSDTKELDSVSLTLALGTGGRYLPGNRISDSLGTVETVTSNFYSLGYRPATPEDGKYHEIEVRVKRPGLQVQHREGYAALDEHARLERSLRSPLIFTREKGTLPVTIELGRPPRTGAKPVIPVVAELPANRITLFPKDGRWVGRVHVYLSIYDSHGLNVGYHYEPRDIGISQAALEDAMKMPFQYAVKVPLPRGSYTIVVTMRDDLTDEIGTGFKDVRL